MLLTNGNRFGQRSSCHVSDDSNNQALEANFLVHQSFAISDAYSELKLSQAMTQLIDILAG
jgi:hypothetical protein